LNDDVWKFLGFTHSQKRSPRIPARAIFFLIFTRKKKESHTGTFMSCEENPAVAADDEEDKEKPATTATAKAKRIITYDAAIRVWTQELGYNKESFIWSADDPENFICGICPVSKKDKTPKSMRCKTFTIKQHCGREKHKEAWKGITSDDGVVPVSSPQKSERAPVVRQSSVFAGRSAGGGAGGSGGGGSKKRAPKIRRPLQLEEEEEEEIEVRVELEPAKKKRERVIAHSPSKKPKNKKPKHVEREEHDADDDELVDVEVQALEQEWQQYLAQHLGRKQKQEMFARRLQRIKDAFDNNKNTN